MKLEVVLTEFSNKRRPHSVGCPFPVADAVVVLVHVQPENIGTLKQRQRPSDLGLAVCHAYLAELVQAAFGLLNLLDPVLRLGIPSF